VGEAQSKSEKPKRPDQERVTEKGQRERWHHPRVQVDVRKVCFWLP